jgi:hypothetical protein
VLCRSRGRLRPVHGLPAAVILLVVLATTALGPPTAGARPCALDLAGGTTSFWRIQREGAIRARMFDGRRHVIRDGVQTGYGFLFIGLDSYNNPDSGGCSYGQGGQEITYPTEIRGTLRIRRKVYVDPKRPFARWFDTITNIGPGAATVDVRWFDRTGHGALDFQLDTTSDAVEGALDAADAWTTTCRDVNDDDSCSGETERRRPLEVASNWELDAGAEDGADLVSVTSGDALDINFTDVSLDVGETAAYMQVVSLSRGIGAARMAAAAIGTAPGPNRVLRGLSDAEKAQLANW